MITGAGGGGATAARRRRDDGDGAGGGATLAAAAAATATAAAIGNFLRVEGCDSEGDHRITDIQLSTFDDLIHTP